MTTKQGMKVLAGFFGMLLFCILLCCEPTNFIGFVFMFCGLVIVICLLRYAGIMQNPFEEDEKKHK